MTSLTCSWHTDFIRGQLQCGSTPDKGQRTNMKRGLEDVLFFVAGRFDAHSSIVVWSISFEYLEICSEGLGG